MGRKSKSNKSEWQKCLHCGIVINFQDLHLHCQECTSSAPFANELTHATDVSKNYGFFHNGILHVIVREGKTLPKSESILLHPSAMKICKITMRNFVVVKTGNKEALCEVWPCTDIHPSSVQVCSNMLTYAKGDLICIQAYEGLLDIAKEVIFSCLSEGIIFPCPEFEHFVKLQFNKGEYGIALGSQMKLNYIGQECNLIITDIVDYKNCKHILKEDVYVNRINAYLNKSFDDLSNIESTLASLHLDDSGDLSKIISSPVHSVKHNVEKHSILSSTPLKQEGDSSKVFSQYQSYECESFQENMEVNTYYLLLRTTKYTIQKGTVLSQEECVKKVGCDDIGGLQQQMKTIKDILEFPTLFPTYETNGLVMTKGIILHGSPGTGKTLLAKAICNDSGLHFIVINGSDIYRRYYGESEAQLRKLFREAEERAPAIIFIDEINAICPKREGIGTEQEKRIVSTVMNLMDNLPTQRSKRVLVLATTNMIDNVDTSLRRSGRFDKEIEIPVPNCKGRVEILQKLLRNTKNILSESDIQDLMDGAHGYTGADLATVCRTASSQAFQRVGNDSKIINSDDMRNAIKEVEPSAMREITIEVPKVSWNDIGGMYEVKQKLQQTVNWPLKHPEAFRRLGINPPRGLLMYGPPGCSKTMIAKAVATESGLNFLAIKGPELFNKWVGESEKAVRELFRKAKEAAPSVIFFDEIDAIAVERGISGAGSNVAERVLTQLLTEMDGIEQLHDVIILAATNRPDTMDKALLRPGRLDNIIYVPLPDSETREEILNLQLKKMPVDKDTDVKLLVTKTNGYSGAEIIALCNEAALSALQEDITTTIVKWSHFDNALSIITPRTSLDTIKFYEDFYNKSIKRFKE